jgi:hypothetical protein
MREAASMPDRTPFARRYLIIATSCARSSCSSSPFSFTASPSQRSTSRARGRRRPSVGARRWVGEYRRIAYETCAAARNNWLSLAQLLGTRAWPEDIARGYARYAREPAVYEACLQGLKGKR